MFPAAILMPATCRCVLLSLPHGQGPNLIINQPDELLDGMSDWCKEHHGKVKAPSLFAALKKSDQSLPVWRPACP